MNFDQSGGKARAEAGRSRPSRKKTTGPKHRVFLCRKTLDLASRRPRKSRVFLEEKVTVARKTHSYTASEVASELANRPWWDEVHRYDGRYVRLLAGLRPYQRA
jgi:hypothetical protein